MSKSARKLRQAKKLKARQKKKAEKQARFAAAQLRGDRVRAEKKGKWRGIHREAVRNRSKRSVLNGSSTTSFKVFLRHLVM